MPDVLKAVKILAGSTVEIAAASVGERSLVKAVRKMEEDGKGLDSSLEVVEPEIQTATAEGMAEAAVEVTAAVIEEELKSAEAGAEDTQAPAAEEETPAPVEAAKEEEAAAAPSLPEELPASAPTVEEVGEAVAEDQDLVTEAAPEEAVSSAEASLEDAALAEEATITAETSVDEAAAEASPEETFEAAAAVDTVQLAAASSGSDLEVLSGAEPESTPEAPVCKSCHSSSSAAEEVAPPVALGGQLASEGADVAPDTKELSQSKNTVKSVGTIHTLSIFRFVALFLNV